jgi:glycosyltransferase involved in cell wall biosynthesis
MTTKKRICIVTYPRPLASVTPLSNLVGIFSKLSPFVYIITGNEGEQILKIHSTIHGCSLKYKSGKSFLTRILGHIVLQFRVCREIMRVNKKVDIYLFFMGEGLSLPVLLCKITRKPVILILAGSLSKILERDKSIFSRLFVFLEGVNYRLADNLVIYSKKLIREWNLQKYQQKLLIAHEHFMDFEKFKVLTQFNNRNYTIGYIGRLSEEKGIDFIEAIPGLVQQNNNLKFLIGGDGPLKTRIEKYLTEKNLCSKVELAGWIPYDNLPQTLNKLRLILLPSLTEGLPNIMLEAMACGTPVLATSVGAIPDLIIDGETGFIMESNSPECVADNILRTINYSDLEAVAMRGRKLVEKEFTRENAIAQYDNILKRLETNRTHKI